MRVDGSYTVAFTEGSMEAEKRVVGGWYELNKREGYIVMRFIATVRDGEVVGMRLMLKVLPVDPSWPYETLV